MALQVAEGAVIGDELKAVVRPLEGAAGPVPAVAPVAHIRRQQRHAVLMAQEADPAGRFTLAAAQVRETGCGQDLLFPVGVEVHERDLGLTFSP